ncbi:fibronectin type III domain-containing protein, partial [Candidatus Woesearchaeota archaeon]|nr:fibronectin type III domain-containing protein [Candidatus Woesearchaeota archaeon]
AFERKISGTVGERIDIATGGYSGLVEQNQYESLGVYFADPRAGEPKFYPGQPVTVWATIRSKTYQDPVIIENFKCEAKKNNAITKTAEVVSPDRPLPVFKLEENDVRCTFKNGLDTGSNEVTLSAKYNFATNAYIKSYFINRETYREMIRENLDPLAEFGITDKEPKTVFTNGPVGISMNVGPLIYVTEGSDRATSPTLNVVIHNRQNTEDKDKRIISQWEGRVNEINEVIILTPPYVTIDARLDCQTDNPDSSCPCNRPVAPYEVGDCRNSCTEIQRKCNEACKDPRGNEDAGCKRECEKSFNGCNEDCDSLFRVSPGEGPEKEIYNGYSLRVYGGGFVKDEYKDIEGEKYATFFCTLIPDYRVLDSKQLATRYFRVRARYDYTLENTLSIPIDQIPAISRNDVTDLISKFSQEYSSPPSVVIDPNLIRAIIYREAKGGVHCCQQSGRNHWRECEPSFDTTCGADRILTSYDDSSIGIMQINVRDSPFDRWKTDASKNSDGTPLCGNNIDGTPKTVYDQDCNIEIGIKLFRQKYDADKGGREYRCRDANGKVIFRETYTEWDAAIRGYHGWGCSSANCDEKCLDELRRYVSIIKDIKQKIDNGAINLLVQASGQLQEAPRTDPLESPLNPIAQDTQNADKSVTISWEASPTPGVQYRIYRFRVDKTQITQIGAPIIIPAGQLSYTDTQGIMDGQTYKYTISALRGREQSEAVPTDEITPVADAPAPSGTP